ncbi:DUF937 domain-containing protein [Sphingosinicella sp. LHD-64]|uniref:DUF937 domain-containing protein n=1 Tax=Sphingosinicella sp. LHD-64 TaxID=3072139 RepID=UPI00280D56EF|nr:DUF937 domain-containing protein [Sphingosinicella sp. LHD-64]MDQ8755011.1 DUF937 domain-containing protein [Sphingosinicella sp. LHD-64]
MDIQQAILNGGGIDAIAGQLGIAPDQARSGAGALLPAILGGFKQNAQGQAGGLEGLVGMLGGMGGGGLFDNVVGSEPTDVNQGNDILGQIFGSKDVSRAVASDASAQSGLDASTLRQMLPMLAMLVGGFLSRQGDGAAPAGGGGLGGMLGSVLGGVLGRGGGPQPQPQAGGLGGLGAMLDMDGDGNPLNDIMRKLGR